MGGGPFYPNRQTHPHCSTVAKEATYFELCWGIDEPSLPLKRDIFSEVARMEQAKISLLGLSCYIASLVIF
jgi:hypothetical protein